MLVSGYRRGSASSAIGAPIASRSPTGRLFASSCPRRRPNVGTETVCTVVHAYELDIAQWEQRARDVAEETLSSVAKGVLDGSQLDALQLEAIEGSPAWCSTTRRGSRAGRRGNERLRWLCRIAARVREPAPSSSVPCRLSLSRRRTTNRTSRAGRDQVSWYSASARSVPDCWRESGWPSRWTVDPARGAASESAFVSALGWPLWIGRVRGRVRRSGAS